MGNGQTGSVCHIEDISWFFFGFFLNVFNKAQRERKDAGQF